MDIDNMEGGGGGGGGGSARVFGTPLKRPSSTGALVRASKRTRDSTSVNASANASSSANASARTGASAAAPSAIAPRPGRSTRLAQRKDLEAAIAAAIAHGTSPPPPPPFHWPHCRCGKDDCPCNRPNDALRQFMRGVPTVLPPAEKGINFLACDPGEYNIATVAGIVGEGEGNRLLSGARPKSKLPGREAERAKRGPLEVNARGERVATYKLRQGEYDRQTGRAQHLAQSAVWLREVAAEHALLATVSRKTMDPARLAEYHAVSASVAEACWANRTKKRISRAAFGFWSRARSCLDGFWATVKKGRERDGTASFKGPIVLAMGDGKWGVGRAPTQALRESARRIFGAANVIDTHEYMTSQGCHVCGDVLQDVFDLYYNKRHGLPPGFLARGLKHCARSSCSSFHDRDVNVRTGGGGTGGVPRPVCAWLTDATQSNAH